MGIAGIAPRRWRTRNSAYVFGMTCISPIAPFGETARASPKLSTRITARIQLSGMWNRCAASVTKTAKGRTVGGQAGRPRQRRPHVRRRLGDHRRRDKDRCDTNRNLNQRSAPSAVPPASDRRSVPSRRHDFGRSSASQQRESWPERGERFSGSAGEDAESELRTDGMFTPLRRFGGSTEERRGRRSRRRAMARSTARQASRPTARS